MGEEANYRFDSGVVGFVLALRDDKRDDGGAEEVVEVNGWW